MLVDRVMLRTTHLHSAIAGASQAAIAEVTGRLQLKVATLTAHHKKTIIPFA